MWKFDTTNQLLSMLLASSNVSISWWQRRCKSSSSSKFEGIRVQTKKSCKSLIISNQYPWFSMKHKNVILMSLDSSIFFFFHQNIFSQEWHIFFFFSIYEKNSFKKVLLDNLFCNKKSQRKVCALGAYFQNHVTYYLLNNTKLCWTWSGYITIKIIL